jgi:hypothetical protein
MTDITAFPAIHDVVLAGSNTQSFIAGAAIKAGQVVGGLDAGTTGTVFPLNATAGDKPIGVAIYDAAINTLVSVAMVGCVAIVANADDTTGIDAFNYVEVNDNSVKGTVSVVVETAISGAVGTAHPFIVGLTLDDIAGGGTGRIMIFPLWFAQLNNA